MSKIQELVKRPGHRYVLVGGSVYAVELVVIIVAQSWLGFGAVAAIALSFWVGLVVSFALQKLVTFSDKRMHHKVVLPQIIAFSLLVAFNFGFTLLVAKLLQHQLPAVVTRTLAIGITTIWNFYLYHTRIFKSDADPVY